MKRSLTDRFNHQQLAEIQELIEKLGPEERAELLAWFREAEEPDELVAAVDEGIQAPEEGRVFILEGSIYCWMARKIASGKRSRQFRVGL
jgi:hypothetical protein